MFLCLYRVCAFVYLYKYISKRRIIYKYKNSLHILLSPERTTTFAVRVVLIYQADSGARILDFSQLNVAKFITEELLT